MEKSRKPKRDHDRNVTAFRIVQEATSEPNHPTTSTPEPPTEGKNPNAVALGKKGGQARAAKLTPEQRSEIAKKAAAKRWSRGTLGQR